MRGECYEDCFVVALIVRQMTTVFVNAVHARRISQTAGTRRAGRAKVKFFVSKWEKYLGHAFVVLPHERGRSRLHFSGEFFFGGVVGFYVVVEDLNELGDDLVAF